MKRVLTGALLVMAIASCVGFEEEAPEALASDEYELGTPSTVISDSSASHIQVTSQYIYYSRVRSASSCNSSTFPGIYRTNLTGGSFTTIFQDTSCNSSPRELVIDGSYIYFLDSFALKIRRVAIGGGSASDIATMGGNTNVTFGERLAVSSTHVFWVESGKIRSYNKSTGAVTNNVSFSGAPPTHLALSGNSVYFAHPDYSNALYQTCGGCASQSLVCNNGSYAGVHQFAADDSTKLFWAKTSGSGTNNGSLHTIAFPGSGYSCTATLRSLGESNHPTQSLRAAAYNSGNVIAYWSTANGGTWRLRECNAVDSPCITNSGLNYTNAHSMREQGDYLYWVNYQGVKRATRSHP